MAALMACATAKFAGEVGVCLATSGPGAVHLLNGLYDAALDYQPVLAIVGQQARTAVGSHYQQDLDLQSLAEPSLWRTAPDLPGSSMTRHGPERLERSRP
jgi:pyruvate dehydrogenase (quinone)